jgi:hypothetical protein
MKKQLLTLVAACASVLATAQSIPNGGFENWNSTSYESPINFMCANDEGDRPPGNPPYTVTKTTDAYHGSYAIRLTSSVYNGDSLQAWFANGNPGGSPAEGGIPYAQMPTGLRFYYKSNLITGDSAIGIVIFKKSGANLAQYFFKIGDNQSNYTLFNYPFTPALTQTPDTVIFACASSNLFIHGPYPGSMLQVDSISFTGVSSQPANFNGSLEQWQTKTRDICLGWSGKTKKTTDKYSGNYAVQLTTDAPNFGSDPEVGHVNSGIPTQGTTLGGHPYTNQVDTIVFWYKYLPANYPLSTDSAEVSACFKLNGSYIGCNGKKLGYAGAYTKVEIPFTLGQAPDTLLLFAQSSLWPATNSSIGSDLKIDQLYLKSQTIPISDFMIPATGCQGVPVPLVDNSANGPTAWQWFMTGASPSNSTTQNPVLTYSNTGTFTVSLQASNTFGSGSFVSKVITIYSNPVVTATSATICAGNTATLTANGASTYTWSNGAVGGTMTVSPTSSTTYSVTGTSTVGCSNVNTASVFVPTPVTPAICMVTVDSLSDNNIVYWDKTLYNNADSFIVYREVSTNTYARIGAVQKSALSQFKDTMRSIGPANGDPQIGSYRYKLKLRDTCGQYSALSPYHNTVKITDQQNGNFQWNTYDVEGQSTPVANFILERDNANTNVWVTVGTVSGTQLSLFDPQYGTYQTIANWRVQATGFNCTPTLRLGNNSTVQGAVVKSKSNITNNRTTSVVTENGIFSVYPNPSSGNVMLSADKEIGHVVIYNALGAVVFSQKITASHYTIDLGTQPAGVYTLQMQGKVVKLVRE